MRQIRVHYVRVRAQRRVCFSPGAFSLCFTVLGDRNTPEMSFDYFGDFLYCTCLSRVSGLSHPSPLYVSQLSLVSLLSLHTFCTRTLVVC